MKTILGENFEINLNVLNDFYPIEQLKILNSKLETSIYNKFIDNFGPYLIELRIEFCNLNDEDIV